MGVSHRRSSRSHSRHGQTVRFPSGPGLCFPGCAPIPRGLEPGQDSAGAALQCWGRQVRSCLRRSSTPTTPATSRSSSRPEISLDIWQAECSRQLPDLFQESPLSNQCTDSSLPDKSSWTDSPRVSTSTSNLSNKKLSIFLVFIVVPIKPPVTNTISSVNTFNVLLFLLFD